MIKSLYSGVTGLKTHTQRMDVIGNNIANVNTTAYKAGTVTFKDVYYQTKQSASGGDQTQGGMNPKQVGYGVQLGTISKVMTQSGLTYSDSVFDCALEGSGFFQVMDSAGKIYYTRLGRFSLDDFGNLVDPNGNIVLGVSGDPTGIRAGSARINIHIPDIESSTASAINTYQGHEIVFEAGAPGPNGNIQVTLIPSDSPFAEMSGTTLKIYMNLNKDYYGMATGGTELDPAYEAAGITIEPITDDPPNPTEVAELISTMMTFDMREAMRIGGVSVDPAVLTLSIPAGGADGDDPVPVGGLSVKFNSVPTPDERPLAAARASNYITIGENKIHFEMVNAGAAGNKYEINIKKGPSISARWSGNVLTITLPDDDSADEDAIQNAVNRAIGAPADSDINDPDAPPDAGDPLYGFFKDPRNIKVTSEVDADDIATLGSTVKRVKMTDGMDSFFQEAFLNLTTVRLTGGYNKTPQDASTCEITIDRDGVIYGKHPIHGTLLLGRIDVVDFVNPDGLNQSGTSYFTESLASGPPQVRIPSEESETFIISSALEMANVDLSQEFSDMIITQRGFQANSRIITVSDTMLEELINLKR